MYCVRNRSREQAVKMEPERLWEVKQGFQGSQDSLLLSPIENLCGLGRHLDLILLAVFFIIINTGLVYRL